jgi:biopolymer transport protein ExbD
MAFGGFNDNRHQTPISDINVTPMVDVMLVLLVIFIITAPLLTHAIKINLPDAPAKAAPEKSESVTISIDPRGKLFWDNDVLASKDLDAKLIELAKKIPQPELQIRADNETRYEIIAKVMSAAQSNGITKLGFITEPKTPPTTPTTGRP